ncbi:hypothetical protein HH_0616 [Helicobacter hepaticus ATCC 51449]|uniref:Uncharacterized protein n=1 Tax=Helicobacter hepaticus (strain ATCC 51449 / 3B1) TaxID=235279 RepID=Q7VII9_HELHP|nr:hypothetical protein HH_0616 [Helicobacter hepaticus ATCC 51449]
MLYIISYNARDKFIESKRQRYEIILHTRKITTRCPY